MLTKYSVLSMQSNLGQIIDTHGGRGEGGEDGDIQNPTSKIFKNLV
jgi:hypothetical protein